MLQVCIGAALTLILSRRNQVILVSWLAENTPQVITAQLTRWIAETAVSAQLAPNPVMPAQCRLQVALLQRNRRVSSWRPSSAPADTSD